MKYECQQWKYNLVLYLDKEMHLHTLSKYNPAMWSDCWTWSDLIAFKMFVNMWPLMMIFEAQQMIKSIWHWSFQGDYELFIGFTLQAHYCTWSTEHLYNWFQDI